jgi:hypothetical protein
MEKEIRRISIPLGAKVTVKRQDGTTEDFVFRGTDAQGGIYEDSSGQRHKDVGVYVDIRINDGPWSPNA